MDNSIDQSLFNEKSLYLLNIRELRDLGRKYGVPSPTTKSKKELVDYILNVIYGKVEIPVRSIVGRHPGTSKFKMENFINKLKTNSDMVDDHYEYKPYENMFAFKLSSPSSTYILDENPIITKVYNFENGKHFLKSMAFIKSDSDIEISNQLAQKYRLENSDIVDILLLDNLIKICTINGIKCKDEFEELYVLNTPIQKGFSQEFFFTSEDDLKKETLNLLQKIENTELKLLVFTKNEYKNKNLQSIIYFEDEDKSHIYKKIINFANLCESCIKNGENIIVIIENYEWIKMQFSNFDTDISIKIQNYLDDIFNKITKLNNVALLFSIEDNYKY